jgi:hypothetical protein
MPYYTEWYIPGQIVYSRYTGKITTDDIIENVEVMHQLIDSCDRPLVHVVSDMRFAIEGTSLSETVQVVSKIKPHPRGGWTISIGEKDKLMKFVSSVSRQILKVRVRSYDTIS